MFLKWWFFVNLMPKVQGIPKKGYPLKSSAGAACSNLNALTPW